MTSFTISAGGRLVTRTMKRCHWHEYHQLQQQEKAGGSSWFVAHCRHIIIIIIIIIINVQTTEYRLALITLFVTSRWLDRARRAASCWSSSAVSIDSSNLVLLLTSTLRWLRSCLSGFITLRCAAYTSLIYRMNSTGELTQFAPSQLCLLT